MRGAVIVVVLILILGALFGGGYISFYNSAVKAENSVKAQYQSNKNSYDAFWKTVKETAQVPDKYKEDFKEVLVGNTEARYGEDGSKAQWAWIQEHAVNFDSGMYNKLMTIIESGRAEFKRGQDLLLDKQRAYQNHLQSFWGSMLASMAGFPNVVLGELAPATDLDGDGIKTVLDYKIITSKKTEAAFQTGEAEALDVFGKNK